MTDSATAETQPDTAAAGEAVFQARGITKTYQFGEVLVHAIRGIDVDLYQGEFVVLLRPTVNGKSTLLNIPGGLDVPKKTKVSKQRNRIRHPAEWKRFLTHGVHLTP